MLTPTQDQWMGQLRQILPVIGTLLTTLGIMTPEEWQSWFTLIMAAAGPIIIAGSVVWSWIANSRKSVMQSAAANLEDAAPAEKAAVVEAVAKMPEVKSIDLDKSQPAAVAINALTPPNVQAT